ncbi:metalloregulator ArsR/SmtB family transcription factor [Paracoccaceae bacterium Fryx2]|nr:metalloregulator ArsR/SmtB family transcription factor [Paracoccaceae bacterium Fryx2]
MEQSKVLDALSALAHAARLDILRLLMAQGADGLPAGQIGQHLALPASRLSFHLAALEQAGLIRSRRSARNVIYAVDLAALGGMMSYLMNDCCLAHPEVMACCRHHPEDPAPGPVSSLQAK